jgi:rfaE bifunctional protein nucleotidyltransferase chain/domain
VTPEGKILPLEVIAERVDAMKHRGKTIVHCHGCFDLLHIGHIKHLQAARTMGDALVVTVTPDKYVHKGVGRPAFTEDLRAESLAALECVDFVAIDVGPTAVEAIRTLRPDYYVKGQEFENLPRPPVRLRAEIDAVRQVGGQIRFTHEAVFSSTALLNQHDARKREGVGAPTEERPMGEGVVDPPVSPGDARSTVGLNQSAAALSEDARRFLEGFRTRHPVDDVLAGLASLRALRALVIGEAIIDEYAYCLPLGKSPKEAIVTTKQVRCERQAGGALACANHVASFCGDVHLVTCLGGEDSQEQFVRDHLRPDVAPRFFVRPDAPTITKRRYMWEPSLVKLFEVVLMEDAPLPATLEDELLRYLDGALPGYDVVIVADYGHGFLSQRAAAVLGARARFLAVNTQANAANLGFNLITRYPRVDYACIDEPELRLATRDRCSSVGVLSDTVRGLLGCSAVSVTRGAHGALVSGPDGLQWGVPAFSSEVVDPMGAGDAFLSVTSPCVAAGMPMDVVGFVGSLAGALAVRIVGNRSPIEARAVQRLVTALLR